MKAAKKKDRATHTFTWVVKTESGIHANKVEKGTCSVCSYKTERVIEGTYIHEIDMDNWVKDETGHYHVSKCDSKTPHNHEPIKRILLPILLGNGQLKPRLV